uniref:Uncharacterized protein n=1 Tax=Tanacetum cinerariifolium TaxID=118510 RepID=A0A699GLS5_TANCI|nr:hypothetical protein [Tanacetum cinerariifolium]
MNKGLVAKAYEWDEEDVSSDDNDMTEIKALMALADDENVVIGKKSAKKCQRHKSVHSCVERPWLSEAEGFTLPNYDTCRILPAESQVKITNPSVAITDSSATEHDSADESLVCSTLLPPLEKLAGVELVSRPKTIKSILKSNSTFKANTLKDMTINEPSSAPAKGNKNSLALKNNSAPAGSSLLEDESNQETLNKSKKVLKLVVALSILQLLTMTLSGLEGVKHFKLRKLKHSNPKGLNHQMLTDQRLPLKVYIHNHKDYLGKFNEKALMVISLDTHLFPKPSESSTPEDNKLKKPITSYLMKALMLSNSQNLHMRTSPLLNLKDTYLMSIFIHMNLLKGIK